LFVFLVDLRSKSDKERRGVFVVDRGLYTCKSGLE
jgi:hypothetical protein